MPYPPLFSSTLTYENRYNLDEIDVFLEGDGKNPMFFNIKGLPDYLNYGKHYFTLSLITSLLDMKSHHHHEHEHNPPQHKMSETERRLNFKQYRLRDNSRVLFEFKSINDVILKSDILDIKQKNGVAYCFVEILKDPMRTFKEVEDGEGTLTVVGSLVENSDSAPRIPEKFKGAMNYRCTFPIEIRKNILQPHIPIISDEKAEICTSFGQFTFAKAPISPLKTTGLGLTYSPTTGKPNISFSGRRNQKGWGKS